MSDETPESLIPYDEIVQDALRAVVGRVLGEVEQSGGLPGEHHFYITFKTRMPGVSIPKHLLERFPDEMTIVIQHKFWDLTVEDDNFTVGLSFGGVPATLAVPLDAVIGFADPYVRYGLRFNPVMPEVSAEEPAKLVGPAEPEHEEKPAEPQVVSLDAFRRRNPGKE